MASVLSTIAQQAVTKQRSFYVANTIWREVMIVIRQDELLHRRYELLVSIPGVAQASAAQLFAELSSLPSGLTVREWAHIAASILPMKYQEAQ